MFGWYRLCTHYSLLCAQGMGWDTSAPTLQICVTLCKPLSIPEIPQLWNEGDLPYLPGLFRPLKATTEVKDPRWLGEVKDSKGSLLLWQGCSSPGLTHTADNGRLWPGKLVGEEPSSFPPLPAGYQDLRPYVLVNDSALSCLETPPCVSHWEHS